MSRRKSIAGQSIRLSSLLKALAENIKKVRKMKRMSQLQVASQAKLAISTVSEIEQEKATDVRLGTVTAIAEALELDDPLKLLRK